MLQLVQCAKMHENSKGIYAIVIPQVSEAQGGTIPTRKNTIGGRSTKRVKLEIRVSRVLQKVVRGQRVKAELMGSSCSYSEDHAGRKGRTGDVWSTHSLVIAMHVVQTHETKVKHAKKKSGGSNNKETQFQMQTKQHI